MVLLLAANRVVHPNGMSVEDWLAVLLQGTVASVVGLAGLLAVFLLTRRHERSRDLEIAGRESDRARRARVAESVAQVVEATHGFDIRTVTEYDERDNLVFEQHMFESVSGFSKALSLFAAREITDHPRAAAWALGQANDVRAAWAANTNVNLKPEERPDPEHLPDALAYRISGVLLNWMAEGAVDDNFDPTL